MPSLPSACCIVCSQRFGNPRVWSSPLWLHFGLSSPGFLRILFGSGSSACPLPKSFHPGGLSGEVVCLPSLVPSSWHSVSRPSVPKIASFLLYLCRSLSLFFSSIASYHSMLRGVFCFVLPELSSHFVLRDLLRSSRVPPWDLSRALSFLRGPPFEPLSSCSLRERTRKVLFLLALATVRRVS